MTLLRRNEKRGHTDIRLRFIHVGTLLDQEAHTVDVAILRRNEKCGRAVVHLRFVHIGAVVDQEPCAIDFSWDACAQEKGRTKKGAREGAREDVVDVGAGRRRRARS